MDFLKSAVASAMSQGPPFPYTFGDKVDVDESIWTLYNGTRREDGSNCSIFSFDITAKKSQLPLAKNALRKLRTLRHPGVIKVLDTVETDTYIYIATERVVPLRWHVRRKSLSPETIKWGLYSVAQTLKFINDDASSKHGSLRVGSIYTSESGEWKLGGFEVLSNVKDSETTLDSYGSLVPDSGRYAPPEVAQGGWGATKAHPTYAVDSFNFGTLIFEVFNGDFQGPDQAGQTKNIPPTMQTSYRRLCNANPKARISAANFLELGRRSGSFFDTPLIQLTEGIDNLGMKNPDEREEFLDGLEQVTDDFPEEFSKSKVLPELVKSVEFGGGGPKALTVVLKLAAKLPSDDFDSKITPFVVRAFANPDRGIRVCLLDGLPLIIDQLPQKIVNDKIFPQLESVTGFTDAAPVVREQTLKSVLVVIGKLSDRTINGDLLKQLAKTANDEQPGIRTNTTICLGKIAKSLGTSSRSKVLIAAFTRSLRDPFVHARNAALMALAATAEYFNEDDGASRILPVVCPALIDKEKLIRDQASRTMDIYLQKVRKAAAAMPESVLPPPQSADAAAGQANAAQPSAPTGSSWAGWAISSFTNKLTAVAGDMQTENSSAPAAASPSPGPEAKKTTTASASPLHRQALASPPPASGPSTPSIASAIAGQFLSDGDGDDDAGDAWGDLPEDDTFEATSATASTSAAVSAMPFGEDEPDFAGWLAAQAQKKGPSKPLPKGLSKTSASKKPAPRTVAKPAAKAAAKPVAAKKIDLAPKETDDDDGWGDGW
ncbi:kinase family [Trichoderma cornu-damae]|uniref:Kinase family n=1 Tax=Trichoderma cornu-damae TaxID=654480 RepID=A0A9P8QNR5_9HYPO|nr:kinase family [Trichoderma cornu-damae]